jgi:predicted amidohydrolase YtcJ
MSYGYTTADEGRATASQVAVMQAYAAANKLPIDIVAYPDVINDATDATKHSPDYVNRFRIGGGKLTIDGSPQGKTAWRDRPYYVVPPGERLDYVGYAAVTNDQAMDAIDDAFKNNYQILSHANGEAAIDLYIAGIREATAKFGNVDRRPVLVHGQFIREDQVDALKELKVHPSFFPMHTFYWGDWHREQTVGPALVDNISPTGWALRRGMIFSSHSDAPVAFPDSMRILSATVTRRSRSGDIIGPDQRVDVITALKAMTIWPAYQHFEEDRKGSIEVGKLGDFVILSGDPLGIDPETLDDLKVVETIKEGVVVYTRPTDPAGAKKASLQYRPGAETDPFANLLHRAALYRDATRTGRLHPFALPAMRAAALAPHNPACEYDVLFQAMNRAVTRPAAH